MKKLRTLLLIPLFMLLFTLPAFAAEITITQPSQNKLIASDRSFYVLGDISGDVPASASLTVTVEAGKGKVVRRVSTSIKNNTALDVMNSLVSYYDDTDPTRADLTASGMPDLVYNPSVAGSFKFANLKAWYSNTRFNAFITGATNPQIDDHLNFTNEDGSEIKALTPGDYTIKVVLTGADGSELGSDSMKITIGNPTNVVLGRFSPQTNKDKIDAWAAQNGYTVFNDSFASYWDDKTTGVFAEIKPAWRAADLTEYVNTDVRALLYNLKKSSTTWSVELGYLQSANRIDDTDSVTYYRYDIGEPVLALSGSSSLSGNIIPMTPDKKIDLTRIDKNSTVPTDNVLNTESTGIASTDTNVDDGTTAAVGDVISVNGVTAPIQNDAADITVNADNTITAANKIATLRWSYVAVENGQPTGAVVTMDKDVGLTRTDNSGSKNLSETEFRHDFTITEDMAGKTYWVSCTGYDSHGEKVTGTDKSFELKVTGTKPADPDKPAGGSSSSSSNAGTAGTTGTGTTNGTTSSKASPKTGIDAALLQVAILTLTGGCAGLCVVKRRK